MWVNVSEAFTDVGRTSGSGLCWGCGLRHVSVTFNFVLFFKECLLVHWKLIWFSFSYSVDGKQQTDGGEIRQKVHSNALKKYDAHPAFEFSREVLWWLIAFRRFGLK